MRSRNAIYNIVSNFILQILIIIYGFIVPKVIISKYGSEVNGLISSITQFLAYIALLDSGFTAVIKSQLYKPIAEKNRKNICAILKTADKLFKTIARIFLIYIIILSVIYPFIVMDDFDFIFSFILIIIISISSFAEYYFGMVYKIFLQAKQKSYIIFCIQIFTYLFNIIFILILANFNVSIFTLKLVSTFIFVLRPIIQNIYVRKKFNLNLKNVNEKYDIKNKWEGLAQHIAAVVSGRNGYYNINYFFNIIRGISVFCL